MNYKQRINRVIDFIGKNLESDLTLDQLSGVACFSKYHFHRLFTAYTGLSLQQYIRWLRLKKSAHQLVVNRDSTIIEIALDAGFESHESFTRAFKQVCGLTPTDFRKTACWDAWDKCPYSLHDKGEKNMNVIIKNMPSRRLATVEHRGNPMKLVESLNKLIEWTKTQPSILKPKAGESFGIAYNDPNEVAPEDFRFDLAVSVPYNIKIGNGLVEKELPEGRYAVALHKGSRDNLGETAMAMYCDWLPKSNEELADFPFVFSYYNFDHEVAETESLTECWLLLK